MNRKEKLLSGVSVGSSTAGAVDTQPQATDGPTHQCLWRRGASIGVTRCPDGLGESMKKS